MACCEIEFSVIGVACANLLFRKNENKMKNKLLKKSKLTKFVMGIFWESPERTSF